MDKARFVYIASILKETVTDSQIISWLQLYEKNNVVFDLILITGLRPFLKEKEYRRIKISEAHKKISGKIYDVFAVKPTSPFYQVVVFLILFFIFLKDIISGRLIVIQTRNATNNKALKWLKKLYSKFKIIYDIRGATAEEFINKFQKEGLDLSLKLEKEYLCKLNQELSFIETSDRAFCVSNKLKEYFLSKSNRIAPEKFSIVPGCADENKFFPDVNERLRLRKKLGISEDRIVLVYSGGLDRPWQIPDFVFKVFTELNKREPKIFLMCLTPHEKIVQEFMVKFSINSLNIWNGYIKYDEINSYLNVGDLGLLFRENIPTNNVASPTKFAEYLISGLPVIISEGIGDFSDFTTENNVGLKINNDDELVIEKILTFLSETKIRKQYISEVGKVNYSKTSKLKDILEVYSKVTK